MRLSLIILMLATALAACERSTPQRQSSSNEGSAAQSAAGASSNEGKAARSAAGR
jgi:hypothetical protein